MGLPGLLHPSSTCRQQAEANTREISQLEYIGTRTRIQSPKAMKNSGAWSKHTCNPSAKDEEEMAGFAGQQPSLTRKHQTDERFCLSEQGGWEMIPKVDLWPPHAWIYFKCMHAHQITLLVTLSELRWTQLDTESTAYCPVINPTWLLCRLTSGLCCCSLWWWRLELRVLGMLNTTQSHP